MFKTVLKNSAPMQALYESVWELLLVFVGILVLLAIIGALTLGVFKLVYHPDLTRWEKYLQEPLKTILNIARYVLPVLPTAVLIALAVWKFLPGSERCIPIV
ncbi:hypothetical protein N7493_000330 [Penicillium malachiteum]|uniref:Uncharacterized protein n=1 Tax=Penicillium malachiteum TaxID=1324776 RepID=A0AAD6N0M1_9EURO|nr:hypothetical protein N7493_000330 [Penicillium malachiteum]